MHAGNTVINAKEPQHQQLYRMLKSRIEQGEYQLASNLPTEEMLCEELGASRYAVREALKRLDEEGYINRRRGAGTTVVSQTPVRLYRHGVCSNMDLLSYAHSTKMEWLGSEIVRTDGPLARLLGCDEFREWQKLRGIRHEESGPSLCLVDVYIDTKRATVPDQSDYDGGPIYDWLDKNHGLKPHSLSQDIQAYRLRDAEAKMLGDPPGASSLRIIRRYFDAAQSMYMISINTFRSHDFVYNMRLQLS